MDPNKLHDTKMRDVFDMAGLTPKRTKILVIVCLAILALFFLAGICVLIF